MNSPFENTVAERFADWNYGHPYILHGFIRALKPQVVVEVGAYRGFGACWMARALQQNNTGKLHVIDNFSLKEHVDRYGDPRTHLEANLEACGIKEWVEIHEGESSDPAMWPEKVDFCYVDGWHSLRQCLSDVMFAMNRGATFIALDDTENCVGPRMVTDECPSIFTGWSKIDVHSDNGLAIFMKVQPRRPITFSQELPLPCVGVDLRPLSIEQQAEHFKEASAITGYSYGAILQSTEHDTIL